MATIYDIAKQVGVSPATVSNAFNRPEQMKPETRERILDAARLLDYRPNVNAQALARGKSAMVGVLVSDIRIPYVANVARGIEDKLSELDLIPVIVSTDGDNNNTVEMLRKLQGHGASGFIVVPAYFGISAAVLELLEELQSKGTTTIVAGHELDTDKVNFVSIAGQQTAKTLTMHLLDLGHRDIAYLGTSFSRGLAVKRWLGYQEAHLQREVVIRPELVIERPSTPSASLEAMEELMSLAKPPTAVFAMNDIFARGVIDYVAQHQIKVPDEFSFVTYDYKSLAQRTTPRVTSMVAPAYDIGLKSAEIFLTMRSNPQQPPINDQIACKLDIRDTSGPPP